MKTRTPRRIAVSVIAIGLVGAWFVVGSPATAAPTKSYKVSAMKFCQTFRTKHLLCSGGYANAAGTIRHYSIVGKTPSGVATAKLMSADKTTCTHMSWTVFAGKGVAHTILRIVTVNGTFRVSTHGTHVGTLAANASKKPFFVKLTQNGGDGGVGKAYLAGSATCGSKSGR